MASQNLQRLIPFIVIIPLSIWLIWRGFRNEKKPLWQDTADMLRKDIVTLGQSPDSLRLLYNRFHADDSVPDSIIMGLIAKPYLPTQQFGG